MMVALRCLILVFLHSRLAFCDNVGWKAFFTENIEEFHDIPLQWEQKTPIPSYVTGTFVRNGAARISFGSKRRVLSNWFEGWAKIHSFKFNGSRVLFSGKMLEPPNYRKSVKKGELVPQMTFNYFDNPKDEWSFLEKLQIAKDMVEGTAYDNNNPAVWRIGPKDAKKGIYLAVTDSPTSTRFDIDTLDTISIEYPKMLPPTISGCTHWQREPGTDNSINIATKMGLHGPQFEVYRWRPEHSYSEPELVTIFKPKKFGHFHSFSITENYAVVFIYPATFDGNKFWSANFHIAETITHNPHGTTDIYLINLKTGRVTSRSTSYVYSLHHANAYEKNNEVIVDLVTNRLDCARDCLLLKDMLNPPRARNLSDSSGVDLYRFQIGLQKDYVKVKLYEDGNRSPLHIFTNHFEVPVINEDYRGKPYCILYGWSAYQVSRQTLVKKNLCDDTLSKIWRDENFNHYSGEMTFVPNPKGRSEDDGVLITIVFDGEKEKSYLLVLDAKTFQPINKAWLPHAIPMSFHGMYFPEAQLGPSKKYATNDVNFWV